MILDVEKINSGYGKVPVLRDITFQMNEGETVAIIGPNGAGKSTLLKTIIGLIQPSSGCVRFRDKDITGLLPDAIVKQGIVYVPEGGKPFPNMSVTDNLRMGAYSNPEVLKTGILEDMYDLFPILKKRGNQYARTLSGGERQMLAIARSLVSRPKLVMFDEPSLGLAPKLVDDIYEKIKVLQGSGLTVLLVEQNTSYALELAERGYVIENGQIVMEGVSSELSRDEHIKKHYLGL